MTERTVDLSSNNLRTMYQTMLRIRLFEEKVGNLIKQNEIVCPCHLYIGQEAVATGVCNALRKDDYVFSSHRSHGHYIAKGGNLNALMAELYGKVTGCSKGRGGSMHLSFPAVGFIGSSAIVAGSISPAVGAALAFSIQKTDSVSVVFFGDGATNEGVWYESLNFAALKKLPIVFVCENNLYSTHVHISDHLADTDIQKKANIFRMRGVQVNGNDVIEVFNVAKKAVRDARRGKGPTLIECMTYRWRGHVGPNDDLETGLRSKEELSYWKEKGPIKKLGKLLLDRNFLSKSEFLQIRREVEKEVDESLMFAKKSPFPSENSLLDNVFKAK
jgi:pyruvate dehydrogenase E1 component alpha subunit|tara:strand:- start:4366 stop:5355 length:990 start_codon:yes stop_codon:yes gene_type:complete